METVVCTAIWVPLRAMLQVFYPAEDITPAEEPDDWDTPDDPEPKYPSKGLPQFAAGSHFIVQGTPPQVIPP